MTHVSRLALFLALLVPAISWADGASDETAIRRIVDDEVAAWNAGDGKAYSARFARDGGFTNIFGMVLYGHEAFEKRHSQIFATFFKGTRRKMTVRRVRFVTGDVALVDVDTEIRGVRAMPPGVTLPADGVLRTRLLQVFVKRKGAWWIEAYHNVDLKTPPGGQP
jgi:uncharacterized protein (TIGR02246 family)